MAVTPISLAEGGQLPDALVRLGVRLLARQRLWEIRCKDDAQAQRRLAAFVEAQRRAPIAPLPNKANDQHYELPPGFFERALGRHLKYSCCYFETPRSTLDEAEEAMLRLTVERAELADGMRILELGCGWGSLCLWNAACFPNSEILAVSNSAPQRAFIEARARERGLSNLEVRTADMNDFDTDARFDRVVSVEMFEHMRNYEELLRRIAGWLQPEGKLFVHTFCHRAHPYLFDAEGATNWMARYFFTAGMMPSPELLGRFDRDLQVEQRWLIGGEHYQRTADAWLARMDAARPHIMPLFEDTYGREAEVWFQRWRMFFMGCAELFGFRGGEEWQVCHTLMRPAVG